MESHITFISELKNLQACSLSTFGASLREAFDLLNVRRLQTGIDHYGQVHKCSLSPSPTLSLTQHTNDTHIHTSSDEWYYCVDDIPCVCVCRVGIPSISSQLW